jgi:hypothetical protein
VHALQLNFFLDWRRSPRDILRDWQGLSDVAIAAAEGGARISVIQACSTPATVSEHGVDFHFIPPASRGTPLTRTRAFTRLLAQLAPDVVHVHGLGCPREVLDLRTLSPEIPILLQDHADRVPRFWRRGALRRALEKCSAVSFCARAQAEPFRGAGLLGPQVEVFEIPESTSSFQPGDQAAARGHRHPWRSGGAVGRPSQRQQGSADDSRCGEHRAPPPAGSAVVVLLEVGAAARGG